MNRLMPLACNLLLQPFVDIFIDRDIQADGFWRVP
jgi:hypothetical protein